MRSLALALGSLGLATAGTVSVPFSRRTTNEHRGVSLTRRDGTINLDAVNNITGGGYYSEFDIGTPGQKISFLLDTGSSDTWVNSVASDLCNSDSLQYTNGYCQATFNPDDSNTFEIVSRNGFDITYLDGRNIQGAYFNDTVTIGDAKVENQQLGLALSSVRPTGIMGLGFSINVAARRPYATIIDNMLSQGLISTAAFSLYLNDLDSNDGTVLFGGIDTEKFIGDLAKLPIIADPQTGVDNITSFTVELTGFKVTAPSDSDDADDADDVSSFRATAILDSGSTISLLPDSQVDDMWDLFDVRTVSGINLPFVDCAWGGSKGEGYAVDFEFDGKTIAVPIDELVIDSFADIQEELMNDPSLGDFFDGFDSVCMFGIGAASEYGITTNDWALLGDTFLRSAYVVYDLANNELGLAQANLNSTDSNVVEFNSGSDDGIPDATGVESQEGGQSTTSQSASSTATSASTTTDESSSTTTTGSGSGSQPTETDAATGDDSADDEDDAAGHLAPPFAAAVALVMLLGSAVALL